MDGKSARGSRNGHLPSAHLPAAITGDRQTISQLRVPGKTNEITGFARLLASFDLTGSTLALGYRKRLRCVRDTTFTHAPAPLPLRCDATVHAAVARAQARS
ncbi:hypothetical protein [Streptomyces aureoversilis]|uniref:Transposase n=1 Tax=Streptomyces aureoversilis TaxID=67277 RepID=A0ABV9ZVJ0_9ACTN